MAAFVTVSCQHFIAATNAINIRCYDVPSSKFKITKCCLVWVRIYYKIAEQTGLVYLNLVLLSLRPFTVLTWKFHRHKNMTHRKVLQLAGDICISDEGQDFTFRHLDDLLTVLLWLGVATGLGKDRTYIHKLMIYAHFIEALKLMLEPPERI